jgi:hypothetical protein
VQAKDIIEQEVNRPGDMWRELKSQAGDISKAVGLLKNLVPGFEDSLDSIVAAHKAKVDQAALAVKKAQIKVPNKILTSVLGGDPFGEKKDPTPVKNLLKAINAMGWKPKFRLGEVDVSGLNGSDVAERLSSEYDIEVDPNDLLIFSFSRNVKDEDELMYIEGAIIPDGKIVIETLASNMVTDGGEELYNNAQELIDNINQYWSVVVDLGL